MMFLKTNVCSRSEASRAIVDGATYQEILESKMATWQHSENSTGVHLDTEFLSECSTRCLMIQSWTREGKFHICKRPCIFLFHKHTKHDVFGDFSKIFEDSPKAALGYTNVFELFRKNSEECRILSRKIRRCFGYTPATLSAGSNMTSNVASSITVEKYRKLRLFSGPEILVKHHIF